MSNIVLNPGSGGSAVATDIHGGDHYQLMKVAGNRVSQWPNYGAPSDTFPSPLNIDDFGSLQTRGAVLTDEGTFRANFANTSLFVGIGSVTVSGNTVTGSGFLTSEAHINDYFKIAADADTFCQQIDSIDSDTQMTLKAAYTGAASGTGNRSLVFPFTGSGGSLAVASGALTMTGGTTVSAITGIKRYTDYGPLVYRARVTVSQRIANQEIHIGLEEDAATTRWFARFLLDGTVNTTAKCETGRNPTGTPSAAETQTTTVALPNGATTATARDYRVELLTESVRFYIDGVLVAEHSNTIPHQHDEMTSHVEIRNGGTAPASSTTVTVDYLTGKNHNKLEIGVMSDAERIVAAQPPLIPFTYSVAGVIAINTDLLVIDCSQFRSLFIQCNSMGTTGVVTVQWSNEPTFAQPITATLFSESGATSTTFNAAVLRVVNVMARYCRLRLTTATTGGTTTLNCWGAQSPYIPAVTTQQVGGTVGVTGYPTAAASADGLANPTVTQIGAAGLLFNGTTWDRARGNVAVSVEASSAKTATGSGAAITNHNARGVQLFVNVGTVTGTTPTLVVRVQAQDPVSSNWVDIPGAATASITATTGTTPVLLTIYPGTTATANSVINLPLPRTYRLAWVVGGTTPSFTFSVGAQYIL
jgi:hypothetical protein